MERKRSAPVSQHVETASSRSGVTRRFWRAQLCAVLAVWFIVLSGPVSIAHAALQGPVGSSELIVALKDNGAQDRQHAPGHESPAQHCAVCQLSQALPARPAAAPVKQVFTDVTYIACKAVDAAKFAPPPLRKPPRV